MEEEEECFIHPFYLVFSPMMAQRGQKHDGMIIICAN
jgi:hypothetical protein